MTKDFKALKQDSLKTAVGLMALSAKTAPKSKGKDDIDIEYFDDKELKEAIDLMNSDEFVKDTTGKREFFMDSDIKVLEEAEGVLAIGVSTKKAMMLNCGKCGCKNCAEFIKAVSKGKDVNCAFKIMDLGFAACSAARTAAELNIDNRVMYDIGEAIRRLFMKDCDLVLGIALSVKGHNIFFDRYLRFFVDKARDTKVSVDELLKKYGINLN